MSTAMASLVVSLLVMPLAAATTGRRNCSTTCGTGYREIQYPFGIGSWCSLPGFSLTCVVTADNSGDSTLMIGNSNNMMDVISLDQQQQYPILSISWYYTVETKMIPGDRDYSVHWETPGRPFAISALSNALFIVGCGVKASLFVGDSGVEVGSCFATCVEAHLMEELPLGPCAGFGCCLIDIQVNLRAFTINISRISHSVHSQQVQASIGSDKYVLFRPSEAFSVSQYGGIGGTATLDWAIPYQPNCKRAMEERASYACVSNHSRCEDSPLGGYFCLCEWGDGNAYVHGGCSDQLNYDSIQPRKDCPTQCGNVSIPFPFGTEQGCFAKLHFYLACTAQAGDVPPVLELPDGTIVTGISITDGVLHVQKASQTVDFLSSVDLGSVLYAFSPEGGVLKWVVDNTTCEHAKTDKSEYKCFSSHSDCVDVTDDDRTLKHVGYRCKCSTGFEGNPYVTDGCTDINECLQPDNYICNGVCQNNFGSYTCTGCPHGTDFSSTTRECKPSTIILGVTIGLSSGGGILFLAATVAILTRRWKRGVQRRLRRRHFRKNKGILLEQLISSDSDDGTKIFSLEELEKATNNFDDARVVGRGGHGTVYKGILTDQRVVAIKKSTLAAMSEIEEFINEVSILSQINHRNVVKLHGCCLESEIPLLVYEFVSNGTLYDLLHGSEPLPWEERLRIATEIAGALTYLHSAASVSILHRDVKSMNVLVNDSHTVKVSDFGASRLIPVDQTHLVTAVQGTFGYLDPEYYRTGMLNEKSDVYSFGVILVELLTRRKPIIQNECGEKQNLSNYYLWAIGERPLEEIVDAQILKHDGGGSEEEGVLCVARLAEECLSLTRGERPTMKDVEMRLQLLTGIRRVGPRATRPHNVVPVVDVGGHHHHGSRQYSQEQEFVSSLRVPR